MRAVADPEGNPNMAPQSSLAIDFGPLQRKNKREVGLLENILNSPQSNVWTRWPLTECLGPVVHTGPNSKAIVDSETALCALSAVSIDLYLSESDRPNDTEQRH